MGKATLLVTDKEKFPDWFSDSLIMEATVGSEAHGVTRNDDHDVMAVFVPPAEVELGFTPIDTVVYRTAWERTGYNPKSKDDDVRSQEGDTDLVAYSLRKYLTLAANGNPSVLVPLFVDDELVNFPKPEGVELRCLYPDIISIRALDAFVHYMRAQKHRLLGQQGQKNVKRPELVEAHGYDTKYAFHMLRLGFQACELVETGRVTLPIPEEDRGPLQSVRDGQVPLEAVILSEEIFERALSSRRDHALLPPEPNWEKLEDFIVKTHMRLWNA